MNKHSVLCETWNINVFCNLHTSDFFSVIRGVHLLMGGTSRSTVYQLTGPLYLRRKVIHYTKHNLQNLKITKVVCVMPSSVSSDSGCGLYRCPILNNKLYLVTISALLNVFRPLIYTLDPWTHQYKFQRTTEEEL